MEAKKSSPATSALEEAGEGLGHRGLPCSRGTGHDDQIGHGNHHAPSNPMPRPSNRRLFEVTGSRSPKENAPVVDISGSALARFIAPRLKKPRRDCQTVPRVDLDDGIDESAEFVRRKDRCRFFDHLLWGVRFSNERDGLRQRQRATFSVCKEGRLSPRAQRVKTLFCLPSSTRVLGVHIETVGAPVDLGCPHLDELKEVRLKARTPDDSAQSDDRLVALGPRSEPLLSLVGHSPECTEGRSEPGPSSRLGMLAPDLSPVQSTIPCEHRGTAPKNELVSAGHGSACGTE
jgi:hypothetical protein